VSDREELLARRVTQRLIFLLGQAEHAALHLVDLDLVLGFAVDDALPRLVRGLIVPEVPIR